jgi:LAGLIDADG-like domain
LSQSNIALLEAAQRMLLRLGIAAAIYAERRPGGPRLMPDGHGGLGWYDANPDHELVIANDNLQVYADQVGFMKPDKAARLAEKLASYRRTPNRERFIATIASVEPDGTEAVYDCSVPGVNAFDANGLYVHNCGEAVLRPYGLCNLTAAVARADDTLETLREKVEVATLIGTIQSMATHFPGLRPIWAENAREERLLGVDITGQMDSPVAQDAQVKAQLRAVAQTVNEQAAQALGIPPSVHLTVVKPSGNSSQLLDCSSGLHARWAPYYIRNVRVASTSPLWRVLKDAGVPMSPENGQEAETATTWVIHFPVKAPDGAITRNDRSAVAQCEFWLQNKTSWTEGNPSCTVTYQPDEMIGLMQWVWDHREQIGGLSFLPAFDAAYENMPYVEITKDEYDARVASFPAIDFARIYRYEERDLTTAAAEVACSAGACDWLPS